MNQAPNTDPSVPQQPASGKKKTWLKRIGIAGFLFFLIKGIIWLFIFYGGFRLASC